MRFHEMISFLMTLLVLLHFNSPVLANPQTPVDSWGDEEVDATGQDEIEKSAKKLFSSATKNYHDNHCWSTTADLIPIMEFYPTFSKLEDVVYMLANCQYDLQMYDGADRLYRYLLGSVKKTRLVPEAILGLQKVSYKKGNYQQSLKFYKALESHYTEDDVIDEARYYAEQTYFNMQNYNLVQNITPNLARKSKFYPFALYTSGLAYLKKKTSRNQFSNSPRWRDYLGGILSGGISSMPPV